MSSLRDFVNDENPHGDVQTAAPARLSPRLMLELMKLGPEDIASLIAEDSIDGSKLQGESVDTQHLSTSLDLGGVFPPRGTFVVSNETEVRTLDVTALTLTEANLELVANVLVTLIVDLTRSGLISWARP